MAQVARSDQLFGGRLGIFIARELLADELVVRLVGI